MKRTLEKRREVLTPRTDRTLIAAVQRVAKDVIRWRKRRNAIRELHALDGRTMRDIGLRRGDIHWVTGKIFSGRDEPASTPPPPGSMLPEAWTVAGRERAEAAASNLKTAA